MGHADLAINHYLCPPAQPLGRFLDHLTQHGFGCVSLTEAAMIEAGGPSALADLIQARGFAVVSLNTAGFFFGTEDELSLQAGKNRALIAAAAALGPDVVLNVIVGASARMPLQSARDRLEDHLIALADQAAAAGVTLVVEPLHLLNIHTKSCLNSLSQVEDLFERVAARSGHRLRLNLDLLHLWWDHRLAALLAGQSVEVGLLQLCDVAQDPKTLVPLRVPLDEGHLDWRDLRARCAETFPNARHEIELFAVQLPDRALDEILSASYAKAVSGV